MTSIVVCHSEGPPKLLNDGDNCFVVDLMAFLYSRKTTVVRWQSSFSSKFCTGYGVRQYGVLSPHFFTGYIRDVIRSVGDVGVGCVIGGQVINIMAYADDIVIIALSWTAMQLLLSFLNAQLVMLELTSNAKKNCMHGVLTAFK